MPLFKKKPVVVEARQYLNDASTWDLILWINEGQHRNGRKFASWGNGILTIPTLEGEIMAAVGDWIIQGVAGEFYPCKPSIFQDTYELQEHEFQE